MFREDFDKVEGSITRKGQEQKVGFTAVLIQQGACVLLPKSCVLHPAVMARVEGPTRGPLEGPPQHPTLVAIPRLLHRPSKSSDTTRSSTSTKRLPLTMRRFSGPRCAATGVGFVPQQTKAEGTGVASSRPDPHPPPHRSLGGGRLRTTSQGSITTLSFTDTSGTGPGPLGGRQGGQEERQLPQKGEDSNRLEGQQVERTTLFVKGGPPFPESSLTGPDRWTLREGQDPALGPVFVCTSEGTTMNRGRMV
ncbi:unnamed protein product [Boreogadus saida]